MNGIKALKELRELCVGVKSEGFSSVGCDAVLEIADEIEREHAQRVAGLTGDLCSYEWRNKELKDALKAICKRFGVSTEWSAEDAAKKVLEALERDYMALPKDADGVPIRVGDELYNGEVIAFGGLAEGGVVFVHRGFEDGNYILEAFASNVTHHVKSDPLREIILDLMEIAAGDCDVTETADEYAAKIRKLMEVER